MKRPLSAGDVIPSDARVIEVRVSELRQLLDAIDPSPFRERDIDPRAEEFIVGWARDLPRDASLALRVHLERAAGPADEATPLADAVHQYFQARAAGSRRQLRELFRRGRISLLIGLAFLAGSLTLSDIIGNVSGGSFTALLREGFIIGDGWRCGARWRCRNASPLEGAGRRPVTSADADEHQRAHPKKNAHSRGVRSGDACVSRSAVMV